MRHRLSHLLRSVLSRSARIEMWYLEGDLAALRRDYVRERAEEARLGREHLQELESRFSHETQFAYEELDYATTERILRRARALRVPYPSARPRGHNPEDGDSNWAHGTIMGQWTLTEAGEAQLRRAIREEEKARRESAAVWFSGIATVIAVLTGLLGARSGLIALEQKELSRLDHLPRIECSVDQDSLIVANVGAPVRRLTVQRAVVFDARPYARPESARLVRYVIDDFYAEQLGEDYEGNQRVAFGLSTGVPNTAFIRGITAALVDSLGRRGLRWAGIEVGRLVHVVYWDWLGKREEEYFWSTSPAYDTPATMERISRKRWQTISASADSVLRAGRVLRCRASSQNAVIQRLVRDCVEAVRG